MGKSPKAILWLLFAAGGTATSFLLPVMIFVTGLAPTVGLFSGALSYETMTAFVGNWLIKLILLGVLVLALCHAAFRLRALAHDFGIRADGIIAVALYGLVGIATLALIVALLSV